MEKVVSIMIERLKSLTGAFRSLPPFAWLLVAVFVVLIAIFPGTLVSLIDKIEQSLLDQRLRYRAEFMAPSEDIVVVALDKRTDEWRRANPDLGWTGAIPPRRYLAEIVNYLNRDGAEAIALDVILKDAQNPVDDGKLEKVLHDANRIYLGAYLHEPFHEYLLQKPGMDRATARYYTQIAIFTQAFQPFLKNKATLARFIPESCGNGIDSLGFGPIFDVSNVFPLSASANVHPADALSYVWNDMCRVESSQSSTTPYIVQAQTVNNRSLMASAPKSVDAAEQQSIYAKNCLVDEYESDWKDRPQFLRLLEKNRISFEYRQLPDNLVEQGFTYCNISPVMPRFLAQAEGLGITSIDYDKDAYLRQIPIFYKSYKGNYYTMLAARAAMDSLPDASGDKPTLWYSPERLQVGDREIPLVEGRSVILNWHSPRLLVEKIYRKHGHPFLAGEYDAISSEIPNSQLGYGHLYRIVSVADILKKIRNPRDKDTPSLFNIYGDPSSGQFSFRGKYVIYGDTLEDKHRTPVGNITYGPEVMATVLDMFLNDRQFVSRTPPAVDVAVVLLMVAFMSYIVIGLPRLYLGVLAGIIFIAVSWAYNFWFFAVKGIFFPIIWPTIACALAFTSALVFRYYIQDREKRELTSVFSKFVSPQVMGKILSNPSHAMENLKGSRKELTVLFSDIHNFTSNFENEEPERIVQQLNEYFNIMTHIVLKHGGTYDKYMGDALMAFFGSPTELPDHADRACRAAIEMTAALEPLNAKWAEEGRPVLRHGIGISTGPVFVGYFGSDEIKNFTVIGANVNLGSRLETYTRAVSASILISEKTHQKVQGWALSRDLGRVNIKGFTHPVQVFALDGEREGLKLEPLPPAEDTKSA